MLCLIGVDKRRQRNLGTIHLAGLDFVLYCQMMFRTLAGGYYFARISTHGRNTKIYSVCRPIGLLCSIYLTSRTNLR